MEDQILDLENETMIPEDVQKKLASILEKFQQMSDEEKEEFKKGAFDVLLKNLKNSNTILPTWLAPYQSYILFIVAVSIVAFLLVIVSRSLYRRVWEREIRREEKKKRKEEKAAMRNKKKKA